MREEMTKFFHQGFGINPFNSGFLSAFRAIFTRKFFSAVDTALQEKVLIKIKSILFVTS